MKAVVFQSHKPGDKSNWLKSCLESVKNWSKLNLYSYAYIEDELFDVIPADLFPEDISNIWPMTDIARVLYAKKLLDSDAYDRVIWIDSDVYVTDPNNFTVDAGEGLALCREVWISTDFENRYSIIKKVNNCIMAVRRDARFLEDYPNFAIDLVRKHGSSGSPLLVGTDVFTQAEKAGTLNAQLIESVLMLSPYVMQEIENEGRSVSARLQRAILKEDIAAFHFAGSFTSEYRKDLRVEREAFARIAENIIANHASFGLSGR